MTITNLKQQSTVKIIKDGRTKTVTTEKIFKNEFLECLQVEMESPKDDFELEHAEGVKYVHESELFFARQW
jgi:hypothetical protein